MESSLNFTGASNDYVLKSNNELNCLYYDNKPSAFGADSLKTQLEAEKLRNELYMNISHELRTPVSIILGGIELMLTYLDNNASKELLIKQIIMTKKNAYKILKIVNDLLDISKAENGYLSLNNKPCNLSKEIHNIFSYTLQYANSKFINLTFNDNSHGEFIMCDIDKIERILLNLLSNAIKFTPNNGSVSLTLNVSNNICEFIVQDNGLGIPEDKQRIIFDRYMQVAGNESTGNLGTGIGLAYVKSIVDAMKGKIFVKSSINHGSTFTVRFPVETADCTDLTNTINTDALTSSANLEFASLLQS